jgi:chitinase
MAKLWIVLVSALAFIIATDAVQKRDHNDYTKNPRRLVCYFGSWANYHKNETFKIEDLNTELCTHLVYGFAKLDEYNYTIVPFDPYLDTAWEPWDLKAYERFNGLRKKNPNLTTMIAIGGWYEGSEKYSDMAKDDTRRKNFVQSAVEFVQKYDFDGLDMDWEYPANRKGKDYDKANYIKLMKELKAAFEPFGFLLSTALSPGQPTIEKAYGEPEIRELNDILDWANVMTYDYHGGWEDQLGHNAPLYRRPEEMDDLHIQFTVNYTVHYYLAHGLSKEKFVMGVPFYGRAWTLLDKTKVHLNDTVKGMSPAGFISGEDGVLGYNELCMLEKAHPGEWTNKYDPYYRAPYAYNDKIWIGFDNEESLSCKIAFLKEMGLSGAMVWALENDDFKNRCGGGVYPLLHRVHSMLNGEKKNSFECNLGDIPTTTTTEPTTPTTIPTTQPTTPTTIPTTQPTPSPTTQPTPSPTTAPTPSPTTPPPTPTPTEAVETSSVMVTKIIDGGHVVKCYKQGMFSHPTDRHKYIVCEYIASGASKGWWIHIMGCAPGTRWFQPAQNCIADE